MENVTLAQPPIFVLTDGHEIKNVSEHENLREIMRERWNVYEGTYEGRWPKTLCSTDTFERIYILRQELPDIVRTPFARDIGYQLKHSSVSNSSSSSDHLIKRGLREFTNNTNRPNPIDPDRVRLNGSRDNGWTITVDVKYSPGQRQPNVWRDVPVSDGRQMFCRFASQQRHRWRRIPVATIAGT
jgi:hypothetical protein